jgi:hypothetical protein
VTQVLTWGCPNYFVQVSDRLVTGGSRSDPCANKTVVYRARDALVSIGYSGIAYVDQTPTDDWIVEHLWGNSLPRDS